MYNTGYGYGYDNAYYDYRTDRYIARDQMTPEMIAEEQAQIARERQEQAYFFGGCQQPIQDSYYYDPAVQYNQQWYQQRGYQPMQQQPQMGYGYGYNQYQQPQQMQDGFGRDYYGNIIEPPSYYMNPQIQQQIQYQQQMEVHNSFLNKLSGCCHKALGIQPQQEPQMSMEERNKQYEEYIQLQEMNHLAALDASIRDEDYVYQKEAQQRAAFGANLAEAKQKYPDDMSTLDLFDKLAQQSADREFKEMRQMRLKNRYNTRGYNDLLYQQPASQLAQMGMRGPLSTMFEPLEKQITNQFGPITFEEDRANNVVNVTTSNEYVKKREIFLEQVKVKNNRMNKGQMNFNR